MPDPELLRISTRRKDGAVHLTISGELDASTAEMFATSIQMACDSSPETLHLDLADLSFCDSSGLRKFVRLAETCASQGTKLCITGAQPIVRRIFNMAGLGHLLAAD